MSALQGAVVAAWYRGSPWLWLLRPLELLFRAVVAVRRQCYRWGLLRSYRPDKPVVVVGNITVGGTGKTPIVIALVDALQARGIRAGVVSRGYGATAGKFPHCVTASSTTADCGDEPLLIYQRTQCPCVVAPSRTAAVRALLAGFQVDVVLSDDGLQHYALARDMEIAVLDAHAGIGNGFCLPAGPLREPVSRLRSVDAVLYRGSDDQANGVCYEQDCFVNLVTGERRPVSVSAIGETVHAVAGIGQPAQFFAALHHLGFSLDQHTFADHYVYRPADFDQWHDKPLIMTEKDAVKCTHLVHGNAWYLKISARLPIALPDAVVALVRAA